MLSGVCPAFSSLVLRACLRVLPQVGLESVPSDPQHSVTWRCLSRGGFQVTVMQHLLMHTQCRGRAFPKQRQHQAGLVDGWLKDSALVLLLSLLSCLGNWP